MTTTDTSLKSQTLKAVLERSAQLHGDKAALGWVDAPPLTYAELQDKVNQVSAFLHNQGIIKGDRVAILSESMPNWGAAFLAITSMGAIAVPILPDFHSNEVQHILRHAGAKAIFISKRLYDKLENGEFDELSTIILIDDFSLIPPETPTDQVKKMIQEGTREFAKLKEAALKMSGLTSRHVTEDDLASIIYTSGTTGHSKGVMLTHKNIVFNALATLDIQSCTPNDRLISVLPLSHTYENTLGLVIPIMQGAVVYYMDKPPTARVLLPAMQKIKPTMILTVPLIIEKIYKMRILPQLTKSKVSRALYQIPAIRRKLHKIAGKKLLSSFGGHLNFYGIGGAALSPDVESFLRDAGFPYAIGYGLTETSPLLAGTGPERTRFRSTGPALPQVELKIHDPNPQTGEGEIWARGDNVMKGYYKDPERTQEVLTPEGWFKTGDLGVFDSDGYLYIKGRSKNMIVGPSGENIYPEQIEAIVNEDDNVMESLVFEQQGQLIARIHINYEKLDKEFSTRGYSETQSQRHIEQILEGIKTKVNERVSTFSRLQRIIEQTEPFEKTPTKKIKRYLYTG
jgi:long-chain acyl-CoA synthetase